MYDVMVIGGGVIGGAVLRELSKYRLKVCLVEKESDVAMGASKANSGIVHAGFDAAEGSLKAKFNVSGNEMMEEYAEELGVKFSRIGSLVLAFSEEDERMLQTLRARGEKNGVKGLRVIGQSELREMEPNVSHAAVGALYAPTGGIVCPYELTIAAIGNAMDNGAELYTDFDVTEIERGNGAFTVFDAEGRALRAKLLINCAGLGAEKIARLCGDTSIHIGARRGEYILLDKESAGAARHTLFMTPTAKGKGILVSPTADGNILLGPTAEELREPSTDTTAEGLAAVTEGAKRLCESVPLQSVITSFAGVRAYSDRHDFIIEESGSAAGVIHLAGIESPGLTSAPAIAKYTVENLVGKHFSLVRNENFSGRRAPDYFFKQLSVQEKNALIAQDPAYGKIVCRCEQITEGEIVRAVRENPPARNIDAVKCRTRAGMGRCQGGFCQPSVAEIIARETGIPLEQVTKSGKHSRLLAGRSK